MSEIPDDNNLSSCLHTSLSKEAVAEAFHKKGWKWRKCSWTDYEIESPYAELVIQAEGTYLMSGAVADIETNVLKIVEILQEIGVKYEIECYDGQELILELTSP